MRHIICNACRWCVSLCCFVVVFNSAQQFPVSFNSIVLRYVKFLRHFLFSPRFTSLLLLLLISLYLTFFILSILPWWYTENKEPKRAFKCRGERVPARKFLNLVDDLMSTRHGLHLVRRSVVQIIRCNNAIASNGYRVSGSPEERVRCGPTRKGSRWKKKRRGMVWHTKLRRYNSAHIPFHLEPGAPSKQAPKVRRAWRASLCSKLCEGYVRCAGRIIPA